MSLNVYKQTLGFTVIDPWACNGYKEPCNLGSRPFQLITHSQPQGSHATQPVTYHAATPLFGCTEGEGRGEDLKFVGRVSAHPEAKLQTSFWSEFFPPRCPPKAFIIILEIIGTEKTRQNFKTKDKKKATSPLKWLSLPLHFVHVYFTLCDICV